MTEIKSVLTTVTYTGRHLEALKELFAPAPVTVLDADDAEGIARTLPTVDVAVLRADLDERHIATPNLKWVHCDHAGLDRSAKPEFLARQDLVITGSAGRAAPALAQHALFLALGLIYDAPNLEHQRANHEWGGRVDFSWRRCLWGKTAGIIGMGNTGQALVPLLRACGMRILAYGRGADQDVSGVDQYWDAAAGQGVDEILPEADVLILCVQLTDQTHHLINRETLQAMKASALLINIARGPVVDTDALVWALENDVIAGAGLDVFEQEPLPADAAVWDAPRIIITPHVTAEMPDLTARSLDIIGENVRRYKAGEPLLNRLMPADSFSHY
ncbi:MAG: D-2-hydroxyacid dehydrogenase [Propionibacteriaceae bacterium]|jgi:phosphoglycerate dehydrogenase-like enzyme|nr:D-2-hydroxyacid dehydrogenase [Propionibacteriaceae bacterium]